MVETIKRVLSDQRDRTLPEFCRDLHRSKSTSKTLLSVVNKIALLLSHPQDEDLIWKRVNVIWKGINLERVCKRVQEESIYLEREGNAINNLEMDNSSSNKRYPAFEFLVSWYFEYIEKSIGILVRWGSRRNRKWIKPTNGEASGTGRAWLYRVAEREEFRMQKYVSRSRVNILSDKVEQLRRPFGWPLKNSIKLFAQVSRRLVAVY